MTEQPSTTITRADLPFKNLLLTGLLGVGKTSVARAVARKLAVDLFDLEEEIELRELMSIAKIREVYGDARLKALEYDLCRQAALMRKAVLVIPGLALLNVRVYESLSEASQVVCLNCELGEILRRLHLANEQQYRDPSSRGRLIGRIRRDLVITDRPDILQLDTTHLTSEEVAELVIDTWATGKYDNPLFHMGPKQGITPPSKQVVGISTRGVSGKPISPPLIRRP
jgi:shikimate kinase